MNLCYLSASFSDKSYTQLIKCGEGFFDPAFYTCFDGLACPILGGVIYLRCGDACYSPKLYHCRNGGLHQGPEPPEKQTPQRTTVPYYPPNTIPPQQTPKQTQPRYPTFTVPSTSSKPTGHGKPSRGDANSNIIVFNIFNILSIYY
ncbi:hypothetical protein PMAC_000668 [Pneumocystis sp. 'macacae']|nr:hypothetical protein PMAC_000668 [Pneumocystis sp. 'macacae']